MLSVYEKTSQLSNKLFLRYDIYSNWGVDRICHNIVDNLFQELFGIGDIWEMHHRFQKLKYILL